MPIGPSRPYVEAYDRGTAYFKDRDYHNAIREFDVAIQLEPQQAMAYYGLGLVFLQIGDWDGAIEQNKLAIARNRVFYEAYMNLGHAYSKKAVKMDVDSIWKLAAEAHGKALDLKPTSKTALHAFGYDKWKMGDFPNAIKAFESLIEADPFNRAARSLLASIYLTRGHIATAWRVYWGLPRTTIPKL